MSAGTIAMNGTYPHHEPNAGGVPRSMRSPPPYIG